MYMYMSTVRMYIHVHVHVHVYPKNGMGEFGLGVSAGKLLNVWPTMHCPCLQGITYTADNENTSESVLQSHGLRKPQTSANNVSHLDT